LDWFENGAAALRDRSEKLLAVDKSDWWSASLRARFDARWI
jgi:hypothetical protein